ncbi:unnamed protein product, partial [Rotaria sordida]
VSCVGYDETNCSSNNKSNIDDDDIVFIVNV